MNLNKIYTVVEKSKFPVRISKFINWKNLSLSIILFCFLNCSKNPETYIKHINGYWEIENVTLANGTIKTYKFNETIDYISVNKSLTGFRKKLKPGINDTYFTSDNSEKLILKIEKNALMIYYETPYNTWKERVLEANETHLKIENKNKDVYLYKKYTPINLSVK